MKTRTEVKMTEGEREAVETLAEYLNWGLSETIRRALKFGLQSLLKFETGDKKADLKAMILDRRKRTKGQPEQKNDTKKENYREVYESMKLTMPYEEFREVWPKMSDEEKKLARKRYGKTKPTDENPEGH